MNQIPTIRTAKLKVDRNTTMHFYMNIFGKVFF